MLYLYIGMPRNGKTMSVVSEGKKFFDAGYTIYSNIKTSYPSNKLTRKMILEWQENDLDLPAKTVFLITEIGSWFDSRNSQSSNNKIFSYFVTQLGHFTNDKQKGLTILGDTQTFNQLDIRGRRTVYKVIECKKLAEKKDEWTKVLRTYKLNHNLILKTIKREIVLFDKNDYALYETQSKEVKSVEVLDDEKAQDERDLKKIEKLKRKEKNDNSQKS